MSDSTTVGVTGSRDGLPGPSFERVAAPPSEDKAPWEEVPVESWRSSRPVPEERWDSLDRVVRKDGPASVPMLQQLVEDRGADAEDRYRAMAWLVTLFHNTEMREESIVSTLFSVVRQCRDDGPRSQPRWDAVAALARLSGPPKRAQRALDALVQIAGDGSLPDDVRQEAYSALATVSGSVADDPEPEDASELSGVLSVLQGNLDVYFHRPIQALSDGARTQWEKTVRTAHYGIVMRLWMTGAVFVVGIGLLLLATLRLALDTQPGSVDTTALLSFVAGLGIVMLTVYASPLRETRHAVADLAMSTTAFVAYMHRVLETGHTFSSQFMRDRMTFEEMQKCSAIIQETMDDTLRALDGETRDANRERPGID